MDKKKAPIVELTEMLSREKKEKKKKSLLEGYLSEDDFDLDSYEDETGGEPKEYEDDKFQSQGILPIKNEIDQIRQIALRTIARLAEDPTSESYQMMKKIWMMCDKAIEAALQGDEDKKK